MCSLDKMRERREETRGREKMRMEEDGSLFSDEYDIKETRWRRV